MSIGSSNIGLLVATLDLSLVRMLRHAMSPNGTGSVSGLGPAPSDPSTRRNLTPEPVIEPRVHYHPTPRFEPRPVRHPEPRYVQREERGLRPIVVVEAPDCPRTKSPIEPPWAVLPWEKPIPPKPEIKVWIKPPDKTSNKGTIIDLFC